MAFQRYYNEHIGEYISNEQLEKLYQLIMNATPKRMNDIELNLQDIAKRDPDRVHTTVYRIAKKTLAKKKLTYIETPPTPSHSVERSPARPQPVTRGVEFGDIVNAVSPFGPNTIGTFLTDTMLRMEAAGAVGRGLAQMITGKIDNDAIARRLYGK